ncbi:MAG: hypothetical protein JSV21_03655 [Nitrospirota bacterium]|nr:MAG: hypothetical protein JSV21_03655 [Nitrospirota bacterium]
MSKEWYKDLPDDYFDSDTDKEYRSSFKTIREGLAEGLSFDEACERIDVEDELLREVIIADMLKVLIAESHFAQKIPLEELSRTLHLPIEQLEEAKETMLSEIQDSALKNYNTDPGANGPLSG